MLRDSVSQTFSISIIPSGGSVWGFKIYNLNHLDLHALSNYIWQNAALVGVTNHLLAEIFNISIFQKSVAQANACVIAFLLYVHDALCGSLPLTVEILLYPVISYSYANPTELV
jgi:hypothetical protein